MRSSLAAGLLFFTLIPTGVQAVTPPDTEPLLEIRLPEEFLEETLERLFVYSGSPVLALGPVLLSPASGLVSVTGEVELPAGAAYGLKTYGAEIERITFEIGFIPKVITLSESDFLQIKWVCLKIDGQDFIESLPILESFAKSLFEYTDIKGFIYEKEIRFVPGLNAVTIKLDLTKFEDLKPYQSVLNSLRLWHFGPARFKGTLESSFYIAVGYGSPSKAWVSSQTERKESDQEVLRKAAQKEAKECCDSQVSWTALHESYRTEARRIKIRMPLLEREAREEKEFLQRLESRVKSRISMKNTRFEADPKAEKATFEAEAKRDVGVFLADLKRRQEITRKVMSGGGSGQETPILVKRLSQRAISGLARYFRDYRSGGEGIFEDADLVLMPHLPGFIFKGNARVDFATLMGLSEGKDKPLRLDRDALGAGIPFEILVRTLIEDDGWLRLEIERVSLLSGREKIVFPKTQANGKLLIGLLESYLSRSAIGKIFSADNTFNNEKLAAEEEARVQKVLAWLASLSGKYQSIQAIQASGASLIAELVKLDLANDPFLAAGTEYLDSQVDIVLDEVLKYEKESQGFLLSMNPRLVSSLFGIEAGAEVWNIEPLYSESSGRSFLEMSFGSGHRPANYVRRLFSRPEASQSAQFVSEAEKPPTPVDLSLVFDSRALSREIARVLKAAEEKSSSEMSAALVKDEPQSHTVLKDMKFDVTGDGLFRLSFTLETIEKWGRGILNPKRWFGYPWGVSRDEMAISLDILANKRSVSELFGNGRPGRLFLGDEAITFEPKRMEFSSIEYKFFERAIKMALADETINFERESLVTNWIRQFLLKKIIYYLEDPAHEENTKLGDTALNRYMRFYRHDNLIVMQLNPRMYSPAFEVGLHRVGLEPESGNIALELSLNSRLANFDRDELLAIISRTEEIYRPYLSARTANDLFDLLETNHLFDQAFYNSDISKLSLLHRFRRVLSRYPDLLELIGENTDLASVAREAFGTECGVEIMYFAAAAYAQAHFADALLNKITDFKLESKLKRGHYFDEFRSNRDELLNDYARGFFKAYIYRDRAKNQLILKRGPTDWNYQFYSDALFSEATAKFLESVLGNGKQRKLGAY